MKEISNIFELSINDIVVLPNNNIYITPYVVQSIDYTNNTFKVFGIDQQIQFQPNIFRKV